MSPLKISPFDAINFVNSTKKLPIEDVLGTKIPVAKQIGLPIDAIDFSGKQAKGLSALIEKIAGLFKKA